MQVEYNGHQHTFRIGLHCELFTAHKYANLINTCLIAVEYNTFDMQKQKKIISK